MIDSQSSAMPKSKSKTRFLLQALFGAVVGAGTAFVVLSLLGDRATLYDDSQRLIALTAGLVFALIALFVGFGVAAPGPGSKLLNVEDSGELRERRTDLGIGVILIALAATILLVLSVTSVGGSRGLISASLSTVIVGVVFAGLGVFAFMTRKHGDEFEKLLSVESAALAFNLSLTFFGGWGILSYLGHADWIGPLGLFAGLLIAYLLAIFWVAGRRGLLTR